MVRRKEDRFGLCRLVVLDLQLLVAFAVFFRGLCCHCLVGCYCFMPKFRLFSCRAQLEAFSAQPVAFLRIWAHLETDSAQLGAIWRKLEAEAPQIKRIWDSLALKGWGLVVWGLGFGVPKPQTTDQTTHQ